MDPFAEAVDVAQSIISGSLAAGDTAIDATAGNGHDTVFLCRTVGRRGHVYAFDIQDQALEQTAARLDEQGLRDRATLIPRGHEDMRTALPAELSVDAVMFNLGFLPGGDKSIITRPETTLVALEDALSLISPGGLVTVVVYPGHEGGDVEAERVDAFAAALPPADFTVAVWRRLNARGNPPYVIGIRKSDQAR